LQQAKVQKGQKIGSTVVAPLPRPSFPLSSSELAWVWDTAAFCRPVSQLELVQKLPRSEAEIDRQYVLIADLD